MAKVVLYRYVRVVLLTVALFFLQQGSFAQYTLRIIRTDSSLKPIPALPSLNTDFTSKEKCAGYISTILPFLLSKGYAAAAIDSVHYDSLEAKLFLFGGPQLSWTGLNTDSVERSLLDAVHFDPRLYNGASFRSESLHALKQELLDHLENTGYPFAAVITDSILLDSNRIQARLKVTKGPQYKIDSIRNFGSASISNKYLQRYLSLPNGSIYKKKDLQTISRRLDELPFLKEGQPWNLTRLGTGSILNLYLEPRKSSQVNVLIGLLPAITTPNNIYEVPRNKLQFTGEATVNLKNELGNGETIGLNWQQIQVKSPRLNISFDQPYLFGSLFGASFNFDLLKKDSSFLTISMMLGARYALAYNQQATFFIQNLSSNLVSVDTNLVILTKRLPQEADVRSVSFGVQYDGFNTDYRYNPTSGNEWTFSLSAGTKKVKRNNVIVQLTDKNNPGFDFRTLYDTIPENSFQFRLRGSFAHFFKLTRVSTIKTSLSAGWFESPKIFRNELFQIGGYRLLRGFDEESIYASRYAVGTVEYRYLIGRNSYMFGFMDAAWTQNNASSSGLTNSFIGAGLGMALETKAGIFNISFAAGKRNDVDLNLRQSKIHFGYINFF